MHTVNFSHRTLGTLSIDMGIDQADWAYGLNTVTFPTYGGEVVQILSVYIDNLTLGGTITTYRQMELIFKYFTSYMQIASQGKKATPDIGNSISGTAYNLLPIIFTYPHRNWQFYIYPQQAAGFKYALDTITPLWQITAFVIDDTPDVALLKDGIKAAVIASGDLPANGQGVFTLKGELSPNRGYPDTDPWQTYTSSIAQQQSQIHQFADYYNHVLLPAYEQGDFSALIGDVGSIPAFGQNTTNTPPPTTKVPTKH